ncbi:N-acetylmuramoyl-L-alanine amidase family protein [Lutispora saccharofermentans]|uniref:N-acetylmuramoyl-L-alanine amidase n=1 Tax=Lutispora saccharofermentans TaxID=3024236 RepID=A0ABT1NA37_9FIRM|nr:N-acetylmuramoyl-L-alanine amidase [Lutispora saccharofermentans]MCQ1528122.1 N-acetylmuramoyl-L-alanine amidase [Lutispora saccharofermentans]
MQKVYIDWGHGMGDEIFSSYPIGEKVLKKLEAIGIQAEIRPEDMNKISLEERISKIRESRAQILISIDSNWSENANQKGVETYYNTASKTGDLLAKKVQRELIKATNLYNRGIIGCDSKTNNEITTLLKANEISIVSLIGFSSNPHERLQIEQDKFKELISDGILKGISRYLNINGALSSKGIFM